MRRIVAKFAKLNKNRKDKNGKNFRRHGRTAHKTSRAAKGHKLGGQYIWRLDTKPDRPCRRTGCAGAVTRARRDDLDARDYI